MKFKNLLSTSSVLLLCGGSAVHATQTTLPLPDEVLASIFSYLTPGQAGAAATVSTQFCRAADERTKHLKKDITELVQKFCNSENIYGYQQGVQDSARKLLALTSVPTNITQDEFDTARLNAINLIYGATLNQTTKKGYATQFKNIYSNASTHVKQMFEEVSKNIR